MKKLKIILIFLSTFFYINIALTQTTSTECNIEDIMLNGVSFGNIQKKTFQSPYYRSSVKYNEIVDVYETCLADKEGKNEVCFIEKRLNSFSFGSDTNQVLSIEGVKYYIGKIVERETYNIDISIEDDGRRLYISIRNNKISFMEL